MGGVSLLVGIYAGASRRAIATIMALGSGVLISSVAFELLDEACQVVRLVTVVGFLTSFVLSHLG